MKKIIFIIIICIMSYGCNSNCFNSVDTKLFNTYGITLFNKVPKSTLKEIHLDNGELLGNDVIIKGNVINIGKFYTHITIADENARLLVILTNIIDAEEYFKKKDPKALMIWGTVERGIKGYPYLTAKAIKKINSL